MSGYDDTLTALISSPDWESLTAYQRALRCCETLDAKGEDLPSWLGIRQIIGKGSGQDINRAKADFKAQQISAIRQMRGISPGVPESLAPLLRELWTLAVKEAAKEFDEKLSGFREEIDVSLKQMQQASYDRDQALKKLAHVETELSSSQALYEQCRQDLAVENKARSFLEVQLNEKQRQVDAQNAQLQSVIITSQDEINQAIRRLEAAEQHALLEVERVKTEETKKAQLAVDKIKKQMQDLTIEKLKIEKDYQDLRLMLRQIETEKQSLVSELERNRDQLVKTETIVTHLMEKNSELVKSVNKLSPNTKKDSEKRRTPLKS